jgi:hypothetical protein
MPPNDQLQISKTLAVPRSIAARTVFVAGTKGSGKTYTAGVMAEEMLAAGIHVLILDPLGVWWGLRHDASGGPGGYPIVILGGEHADVPLLPTGGEAVAEYVVRSGQSCIVDMSGFDSDAEQDRFVTALLKRLFRLKATDKAALHLVMDEADMFAPQQPVPGQQVMLGATKTIVTKGRSRGLSMTMITQRPQSISTALRDESDVFLCHRIQGPRAADAVQGWVEQHATREDAKSFMGSLATLENGECWVWSPQFLKTFERVRVRAKRTFDSSRTPDPGETARKPKAAAKVDLDKLTTEMRATAEAVKASDPTALRKRVADLERELAAKPAAAPSKVERVEVPAVSPAAIKRVEDVVGRLEREGQRRVEAAETLRASGEQLQATAREFSAALRSAASAPAKGGLSPTTVARPVAPALTRRLPPPASDATGREALTGPERKIVDAIAWMETIGVPEPEQPAVAFRAGYTMGGGAWNNPRGALRSKGLVEYVGDRLKLTEAGRVVAVYPDAPPTTEALHDSILNVLPGPEGKLLRPLLAAYPNGLTNEQLAEASGYATGGGAYNNPRGRLRTLGLIEYAAGVVRARDILFPAMAGA